MPQFRTVTKIIHPHHTMDGAGVALNRVFSFGKSIDTDPFLLLDHFGSDNPNEYLAGFPWHPHRGIETVTYMLNGEVEHGDSIGNKGIIGSGDIQWMTAGSGIVHQEMPLRCADRLEGFQLWVNLPKKSKMMKPRYRGILAAEIPEVTLADGVIAKLVCGSAHGAAGPVTDLEVEVTYLDISMQPGVDLEYPLKDDHAAFIYVFRSEAEISIEEKLLPLNSFAFLSNKGNLRVSTLSEGARFLLLTGKPLHEPVAWRGPIVMNTEEELDTAFTEYQNGTFIKR